MPLDIAANRRATKYGHRELAARLLWQFARPLFRYSPRPLFAWRNFLLRCFGARVGRNIRFENSVRIQYPWMLEIGDYSAIGDYVLIYNLGKVTIGARVTISQQAHLCAGTHDYTRPEMPLERLPISIGDDVWICADAFIGPSVSVGQGAVVGARSAVFHEVQPWTVVGGNPARFIKDRVLECREAASRSQESLDV
jgi:putative colanic acid biosynthesis acetyltransferase WcaF